MHPLDQKSPSPGRKSKSAPPHLATALPNSPFADNLIHSNSTDNVVAKSPFVDNLSEIKVESIGKSDIDKTSEQTIERKDQSAEESPDFLKKMSNWLMRSKSSPAKPPSRVQMKLQEETEIQLEPVSRPDMHQKQEQELKSSFSETQQHLDLESEQVSNITNETTPVDQRKLALEWSLGDVYKERGINGGNPMLKTQNDHKVIIEAKSQSPQHLDSLSHSPTSPPYQDVTAAPVTPLIKEAVTPKLPSSSSQKTVTFVIPARPEVSFNCLLLLPGKFINVFN